MSLDGKIKDKFPRLESVAVLAGRRNEGRSSTRMIFSKIGPDLPRLPLSFSHASFAKFSSSSAAAGRLRSSPSFAFGHRP